MLNHALIFIKPHATVLESVKFIESFLEQKGISLLERGELTAEEIDKKGIIEQHYFAIANIAVSQKPQELKLSDESKKLFQDNFDISWPDALEKGLLFNGIDLQVRLGGISGVEINKRLCTAKQIKLAPGFYAGRIDGVYVLNGFYPALKEVFTAAGNRVLWYHASFDPQNLSWSDFRGKVIGATDPSKAVSGSLRHELYSNYSKLGLKNRPTMSENGVHASAGPLEGLRERMVWLGVEPQEDEFGKILLENGSPIQDLLENKVFTINGKSGPIFDLMEDRDSDEVLRLLK